MDPAKLGEFYDVPEPELDDAQFDRLHEAIKQLPDQQKEVIEQLWLEAYNEDRFGPTPRPGVPVAIVAARMKIARSAVRGIEKEALASLQELLGEL